jgi:[acyl-carrier-protein] S-malonyltransferase
MGKDFRHTGVFDEVDEALGEKFSDIIFGEDAELLSQAENAQPALLAASIAAFRAADIKGDYVLGHSLGEIPALVASGSLDLSAAARLLRARGLAMKRAAKGAMLACLGLPIEQVQKLSSSIEGLYVANDNCPGQVVVSGMEAAIAKAEEVFMAAGAKRTVKLAVTVPAHCPLMAPAAIEMEKLLADIRLDAPKITFVSNCSAKLESDPEVIKRHLIKQMTHGVRFRECIQFLVAQGVAKVVEFGSGNVLCGLVKRTAEGIETFTVEKKEDIDVFACK